MFSGGEKGYFENEWVNYPYFHVEKVITQGVVLLLFTDLTNPL